MLPLIVSTQVIRKLYQKAVKVCCRFVILQLTTFLKLWGWDGLQDFKKMHAEIDTVLNIWIITTITMTIAVKLAVITHF